MAIVGAPRRLAVTMIALCGPGYVTGYFEQGKAPCYRGLSISAGFPRAPLPAKLAEPFYMSEVRIAIIAAKSRHAPEPIDFVFNGLV